MLMSAESELIPHHNYEGSGQDQSAEKRNVSSSLLPRGRGTKTWPPPCAHAQSGGRRPKGASLLRFFPQLLGGGEEGAGNRQSSGGPRKL